MLNFWPFYIREVWRERLQGFRTIAVFGAGEHTRWLLDVVRRLPGPEVQLLIDDRAETIKEVGGIPVLRPEAALARRFDAIVVSSDSVEEQLARRAGELFPGRPVVRLYEGLPCGPYDKQGELPAAIETIPGPGETVNLETVIAMASGAETKRRLRDLFNRMEADPYAKKLADGYERGIKRFGDAWRYVDLWSVLYACARLAGPKRYLEVGTRRGHSLAAVLLGCHDGGTAAPRVTSCDLWVNDYAGSANPGPEFVAAQMKKLSLDAEIEFLSGSSHEVLPPYLRGAGVAFDMITVDGDHSRGGARADLLDVVDHVAIGGMLAFDDINHPQHAYLGKVWREVMSERDGFEVYENPRNGTGIAAAIRYRVV